MNAGIPLHIAAVLMLGIISQIGQVLLLREFLMVFHGSELSIGIILAAWLAWVGLGSRLGTRIVHRLGRPVLLLRLSAAAAFFLLPLTILAIRSVRGLFNVLPGAYLTLWEMLISCFALMGPFCLIIGAQFVLLARVWRERANSSNTTGADKTYIVEAAGNMLGGVIFTFVLVHLLNPFQNSVLTAGLMLAATLLILPAARPLSGTPARSAVVLLLLLVFGASLFYFLEHLDQWAHKVQWKQAAPQHQLVQISESRHGSIAVLKRQDQYSFFQSGHLVFSTAGPETLVPGLEGQEAVSFAHLAMVQHQDPERILLIGGGLRGTLSEIMKHPVKKIDFIELDEKLIRTAAPYVHPQSLEVLSDPRVNLMHTDARLFVKQADKKYDMIIVDSPDPTTAAMNRFYTMEFFKEAREILNPQGVLITGAVSTPDLRGTAIANRNTALFHTLDRVFSHTLVAGDRFMFYFASDDPEQISVDPAVLQTRYSGRGIEAQGFSPAHYQVLLEQTQLRRVNWVVRHHGRTPASHLEGPPSVPVSPAPVQKQVRAQIELDPVQDYFFLNTDFRPIAYFYTLMYWNDLTRRDNKDFLKIMLRVQPWWILPFIGAVLVLTVGLRMVGRRFGSRPDTSLAVTGTAFSTGMSTMTLQVALLFSFQNIYGFIYELVGLIVAMFMLGLAMGAFLAHCLGTGRSSLRNLLLAQGGMALLAGLMGAVLPLAAAAQPPGMIFALFSVLTFSAGLINGINFPLAAGCFMELCKRPEHSAGRIYGAELFGACLGAVLASALIAPILGIVACCLLAAAANATAFITLLISRR